MAVCVEKSIQSASNSHEELCIIHMDYPRGLSQERLYSAHYDGKNRMCSGVAEAATAAAAEGVQRQQNESTVTNDAIYVQDHPPSSCATSALRGQ